ncbi:MAG: DUF1566 domain-containing protein [Deltaproteobacteria bacterium]|nr:DUF1566 domain-containing protein [Deltaproteobacteria bacterium]
MKASFFVSKFFIISRLPFILFLILIWVETGECTELGYYSIHLASFKELRNANNFVNSLANKGKILFWKKTDVPGKGEYYRVYLGKYQDRDSAVEFWKKLKEEGGVNYFGIHKFREAALPAEIEKLPPVAAPEEENAVQASIPELKKERFVDNKDGTITDTKTNLVWIKNGWKIDFFSAVNWQEAKRKCENFKYGGYTDWRLPTVKEWKSLLDKDREYPAIVEPNPFENIIVHMPYWSDTEFNSNQSASLSSPVRAYTVMLYYGRFSHQNINKLAFILPVRSQK